jgi:F-box-like
MSSLDDLLNREVEIENAKAQLFSQIDELNNSLAHIRVCIAEIRDVNRDAVTSNLPDETLAAIFEAGLALTKQPYVVSWNPPYITRNKPFEILVSSVSRRWRNVALQTPRLWTDIRINVSKFTAGEMLDLYLSRSKSCFLDIAFTQLSQDERSYDPDPDFDTNNFVRCLGQLVPYMTHWRQFVIEGVSVGPEASDIFSPLAALYAPALETMVIDCYCNPPLVLEVFSVGAPFLSYMELMEVYFVPPLNTVTSLKLRARQNCLSYTDFHHLMSHMRSLTHLSMDAEMADISDLATAAHQIPHVELHSAVSLDLQLDRSWTRHPSVGALCFLDLPALESLVIRGTTVDIVEAFTRHRHSYLSLRTLTLTSPLKVAYEDLESTNVREFIRLFPNIQNFAIDGTDPTFLRALCEAQTTDELLWPQLSVITLRSNPALRHSLTLNDIVHLVVNRATLGHPISRITLSSYIVRWAARKEQERLKELVELEEC